jgi:IclR family transcriptional regulator, KDG regulon repressor
MDMSPTWRDMGVSSIAKALSIIEYIGSTGRRTFAEVSEYTGLPRSTLLRLMAALIEFGFLRRIDHGEYGIALKLWRIGCTAMDYENLHEAIIPALRHLAEETSETALYAVYERGQAVYVEKVEGSHPIRAYASVGGYSPAYATATGKALLAWRDEGEIARVGAAAVRLTEATRIGSQAALQNAAEVRRKGFAINRGEWRAGVWGVAAPVFGRDPQPLAAIGVSGPRDRIEPEIGRFSEIVRAAARELSIRHGYVPRVSTRQDDQDDGARRSRQPARRNAKTKSVPKMLKPRRRVGR